MPLLPLAGRPGQPPAAIAPALAACLLIGACSPTFNWREVRPADAGIQTLMPCKPDTAERQVPLGPVPVPLHMASCETGGFTYALAWVELGEGVDLGDAQKAWESASRLSLRAPSPGVSTDVVVPGAQRATGVVFSGQNPQGARTDARTVYLQIGRRLYQAAVYGHPMPSEATDPFFENLKAIP